MMSSTILNGDPRYYKHILIVLYVSFFLCMFALIVLNFSCVEEFLVDKMKERKAFIVELYFWSALGATIASYKFFANDKELNETESLKESPDSTVLRYPNVFDVNLYILRILLSGGLGIIGAVILFAGLGYFDADQDKWLMKQEMFFIVYCFLIGVYQNDFLGFLSGLKSRLFKSE